ncbi:hypothetical protein SprV_0602168300 [Sparganum proliferum]
MPLSLNAQSAPWTRQVNGYKEVKQFQQRLLSQVARPSTSNQYVTVPCECGLSLSQMLFCIMEPNCVFSPTASTLMLIAMSLVAYLGGRPGIYTVCATVGRLIIIQLMHTSTRISAVTSCEILFTIDGTLSPTTKAGILLNIDLLAAGCAHSGLTIDTGESVVILLVPHNTEYSDFYTNANGPKLKP